MYSRCENSGFFYAKRTRRKGCFLPELTGKRIWRTYYDQLMKTKTFSVSFIFVAEKTLDKQELAETKRIFSFSVFSVRHLLSPFLFGLLVVFLQ